MTKRKLSDELMAHIEFNDDPDAPDGAWWARLEDAVAQWNQLNGTNFDTCDTVHRYVKQKP